jgi:predicted AAA+ superfamily ATPase
LKRKLIDELIHWKEADKRIPLLLTGAKGVGKTYLAYDFAKAFFEHIHYVNMERDPSAAKLFTKDEPNKIKEQFMEYFHLDFDCNIDNHILIIDEVSCKNEAYPLIQSNILSTIFPYILLISSKPLPEEYFTEIPKVAVHPLEFDEFLRAIGSEWYIETITHHFNSNKNIPDIVHKELLALHLLYMQIGGMPGMINEYLNLLTTVNITEQQNFLIGSYHDYILKDFSDNDALKMNQVFDSLVYQLCKDNKKFQYKLIRKGTTHAMYKDAIHNLTRAHYVIRCNRLNNELLNDPINAFLTDNNPDNTDINTNFKLYMPDTGLLYSKMIEEQGTPFNHSCMKALLENYVAQSLLAKKYPFVFWESDSIAKIEFIIYKDNNIIPIEIHDSDNTRSKNISIFKQKCDFPYAIKISSKNFDFSNQIKYVPYYSIFCL